MTDTVKTVLIVGGVAVGVVVLMKALSPPSPYTNKQPTATRPTDVISWNSVFALGAAAFNAFGNSKPETYPNAGTYRVDTGFTVTGNTLQDDSGKTLVYGTD